jgi:hypothetical protein
MIKYCKKCGRKRKGREQWREYCYDGCHEWHEKQLTQKRYHLNHSLNKCIFCKKTNIEVHHIDKNKKNNKKENLLKLCPHCHRILHSKIYKQIWLN